MAFPLVAPKQQFFDDAGEPLSGGFIEFRNPSTDAYVDTYPTADDADAGTNANLNPLTLDSRGEAPVGIFLTEGTDYKVILKDSGGSTIWTIDDVSTPVDAEYIFGTYTYTPAGGTARTLQSKLDDSVVSVKDFGAKGDGSTDDATAIQNAVDYIEGTLISGTIAQQNTFNSYQLYFPPGRYLISTQIDISLPGIIVKGAGCGATTIQHTSNDGGFLFRHADYLDGQNMNNNGVMDLTLLGTASASVSTDIAISAYVCRFFRVQNVRFVNWSGMIDLHACEEPVHITDCVFWHDKAALTSNSSLRLFALAVNAGTTNAAIDPDTSVEYYKNSMVFVDNCEFRALASTTNHHVYVDGVDGLYVTSCHFLNATDQVYFDPVSSAVGIGNVKFMNCFFDGTATETTRNVHCINKTFTTAMSTFNLRFSECKFNGADNENILLDHEDLQDFVVDGGMCDLALGNYMVNAQFGTRLLSISNVTFRHGGGGPDTGMILLDARNASFFDRSRIRGCEFYPSGGSGGNPARIVQVEGDGTNTVNVVLMDNIYQNYSALASFLDDNSTSGVTITEVNNRPDTVEQATGTYTIDAGSDVTEIDSSAGAVTATLGSATTVGHIKTIVMTDATNSSTVSVTNHETSDPEVITFNAVDETAVLMWTGTEWITLKLSGATV